MLRHVRAISAAAFNRGCESSPILTACTRVAACDPRRATAPAGCHTVCRGTSRTPTAEYVQRDDAGVIRPNRLPGRALITAAYPFNFFTRAGGTTSVRALRSRKSAFATLPIPFLRTHLG